ncbi:integral membrane [Trichoderma cornu-damae]|uniref:Integral membrane n=1 Tax=Trichoderma cornu-damae TaxID=654480 RepID=A0A9P8QFE8_9HYPO|nr:integral membrane [Trichoderma cornu-damae]
MSIKFERDTIQTLQDTASTALRPFQQVAAENGTVIQRTIKTVTEKTVDKASEAAERAAALAEGPGPIRRAFEGAPPLPGTSGKHPIAETIGTALTGGKSMAGTKGYLAAYIKELESNPLRTKMLTAGTLAGAQEFLASWLAKDRNKHGNYFTSRVPKMAAYGALVSAPLGHFLIWLLQKLFKGRVSLRAKIIQIVISNLVIAPIQNSIYLVAMALIAGARTFHQVRATVKVGFWRVMRISWLTSPICLAFAQQFLPDELWVPFFNLVSFVIGTYINTLTKKKRLAALRKKHYGDSRENRPPPQMGRPGPEDYPPPPHMGPNPNMGHNPNMGGHNPNY